MSGKLLDTYPSGSTIYALFDSFDSAGASVTLTGLAVTDVEIYKAGSTTQRSSDAGIALLDTDGIDFDTLTGIHGISIDLSDNTDAGFYAAGSQYTVVISSVTIDSQTVSFILGSFRIVAAENTAGLPVVEADTVSDAAVATAANQATILGYIDTEVAAILAAVDTEVAAIKAVTDALPDAGALTTIDGNVDAILADTGTDGVVVNAAGLAADAVTEIVNGILAGEITELASLPAASPTLEQALALLYMALRNRRTTTASADTIQNDAGATIATATLSDDSTTFTKSEYA